MKYDMLYYEIAQKLCSK